MVLARFFFMQTMLFMLAISVLIRFQIENDMLITWYMVLSNIITKMNKLESERRESWSCSLIINNKTALFDQMYFFQQNIF